MNTCLMAPCFFWLRQAAPPEPIALNIVTAKFSPPTPVMQATTSDEWTTTYDIKEREVRSRPPRPNRTQHHVRECQRDITTRRSCLKNKKHQPQNQNRWHVSIKSRRARPIQPARCLPRPVSTCE